MSNFSVRFTVSTCLFGQFISAAELSLHRYWSLSLIYISIIVNELTIWDGKYCEIKCMQTINPPVFESNKYDWLSCWLCVMIFLISFSLWSNSTEFHFFILLLSWFSYHIFPLKSNPWQTSPLSLAVMQEPYLLMLAWRDLMAFQM